MENGLILVQQLRYLDMIKILGLLKSFTFVMLSNLGAFFKNGYTKLIRGYYKHTGCSKKIKAGYFGMQKWRYMDMIKIMDV